MESLAGRPCWRAGAVSALGGFPDLTGYSPEQPGLD